MSRQFSAALLRLPLIQHLVVLVLLLGIFCLGLTLPLAYAANSLTTEITGQATFICPNKQIIKTTYLVLSDGSQDFVKLAFDGMTYTLPHAVSGSGARYTDEIDGQWWEAKGEGQLEVKNDAGEWVTLQQHCIAQR